MEPHQAAGAAFGTLVAQLTIEAERLRIGRVRVAEVEQQRPHVLGNQVTETGDSEFR